MKASGPARAAAIGVLVAIGGAAAGYLARPAQAQIAVENQGYVPFSEAPIFYRTRSLTDPVARLQQDLRAGRAKLAYEPGHGYLKSLLKLLKIPVSSQTLVFSKTSFQYPKISPDHPRALYFNDDVYVGAVHQGKALEVISFDPMQGAIFYILDEGQADKPTFQRAELDCTQCHIAASTRGVPGVMLRSVQPTANGALAPRAPSFITDQKSPLKERWGGWYVTGQLARASMGNGIVADPNPPQDPAAARRPRDLTPLPATFARSAYLTSTSDDIALLVLAHQTQMHNLITLTNYQTRLALHALAESGAGPSETPPALASLPEATRRQIERPAEQLLRYLLFVDEAPPGTSDARKAIADSAFAREFSRRGARDSRGRSLRDFDLRDRTFRYPCSYLIYSEAFDALPEPAKGYVLGRLLQVLSGQDQSADFSGLSAQDRRAILAILLETKPGLPEEWTAYARANRLRVAALSPGPNGHGPQVHQ